MEINLHDANIDKRLFGNVYSETEIPSNLGKQMLHTPIFEKRRLNEQNHNEKPTTRLTGIKQNHYEYPTTRINGIGKKTSRKKPTTK